ncbi:MAG: glycosyltransferase family 2 protein [Eggerthellaceae bacterium]|jgi:glycosyltransferase involved in cell wall biosynthesis
MDISIVVPVYGCRAALPELYRRLVNTLEGMNKSFEIILVDDHCPQGSWEDISKLADKDDRVVGIRFSRNFGQIKAITAGLDASCGDWVVVMDCDLQDRPEGIVELYNKAQEGYDVVFARRKNRQDTTITKFFSKAFYKVYDYFTDGNFDNTICNYSISKRIVIDAYCSMREQKRAYTLFIRWLGFSQTAIDLEAAARYEGKSSYSFKKKLKMAFELITAQSTKPLKFAINLGFLVSLASFITILYLVIRYCINPAEAFIGWTSTIAIMLLMGGLIMAAIGIAGLYIGNIFDEVKGRPLYVVKEIKMKGKEK